MSSTAPPTRPSTATTMNGTRYQVGSSVVSAPIGSLAMLSLSLLLDSASKMPNTVRTTGATAPPNVAQPTPKPVATSARAPMNAWVDPEGAEETLSQSTSSSVSAMKPMVSTIVAMVIHACSRMITSKPRTPAVTTRAAVTRKPSTLVASPPPQPSSPKTVAVPSDASDTSTVSQPTRRTQ